MLPISKITTQEWLDHIGWDILMGAQSQNNWILSFNLIAMFNKQTVWLFWLSYSLAAYPALPSMWQVLLITYWAFVKISSSFIKARKHHKRTLRISGGVVCPRNSLRGQISASGWSGRSSKTIWFRTCTHVVHPPYLLFPESILLHKLTGRLPVEFREKHSMLLAQYKIICPILIVQLNTDGVCAFSVLRTDPI